MPVIISLTNPITDFPPGSRKYMKLNTKVLEGRWSEQDGIWRMSVC